MPPAPPGGLNGNAKHIIGQKSHYVSRRVFLPESRMQKWAKSSLQLSKFIMLLKCFMKGHKLARRACLWNMPAAPMLGVGHFKWVLALRNLQLAAANTIQKKEGFKPGNGLQTLCGSFYGPLFNLWLKYISTTKPWSCRKAGRTCYTSGTPKATNKGQLDAAAT